MKKIFNSKNNGIFEISEFNELNKFNAFLTLKYASPFTRYRDIEYSHLGVIRWPEWSRLQEGQLCFPDTL